MLQSARVCCSCDQLCIRLLETWTSSRWKCEGRVELSTRWASDQVLNASCVCLTQRMMQIMCVKIDSVRRECRAQMHDDAVGLRGLFDVCLHEQALKINRNYSISCVLLMHIKCVDTGICHLLGSVWICVWYTEFST